MQFVNGSCVRATVAGWKSGRNRHDLVRGLTKNALDPRARSLIHVADVSHGPGGRADPRADQGGIEPRTGGAAFHWGDSFFRGCVEGPPPGPPFFLSVANASKTQGSFPEATFRDIATIHK